MTQPDAQLQELIDHRTVIEDFLRASPYDPEYDINGRLTEPIFFEHLFVDTPDLGVLRSNLESTIENIALPNRVVFVTGYAGNGKTTFIRSFMNHTPGYQHVYYDFRERRADLPGPGGRKVDEVMLMLQRAIRAGIGVEGIDVGHQLEKTFQFLYSYRDYLKDEEFISHELYGHLNKYSEANPVGLQFVRKIMGAFTLKDTFTCFFIQCFLHSDPSKKKIIYFDNLDVTAMEYLSGRFLEYFQEALSNANMISRSRAFRNLDLRFPVNFRFVFCLRDANDAIINQHVAARVGLTRIPFYVAFDSQYYREIARKRIDFIGRVFSEADIQTLGMSLAEFKATFSDFIEDDYFVEVFVPLYNHDYRNVVSTLLHSMLKYPLARAQRHRYGVRGLLMHQVVGKLMIHDFLGEYLATRPDLRVGYCYIDRVMLTVLINQSNYVRGANESRPRL